MRTDHVQIISHSPPLAAAVRRQAAGSKSRRWQHEEGALFPARYASKMAQQFCRVQEIFCKKLLPRTFDHIHTQVLRRGTRYPGVRSSVQVPTLRLTVRYTYVYVRTCIAVYTNTPRGNVTNRAFISCCAVVALAQPLARNGILVRALKQEADS